MGHFWLTVGLPILAGTLCVTGIGLTTRYVLRISRGSLSPLCFLSVYYATATIIFGAIYLANWGWTYPPVLGGFWTAVLGSTMANVFIQFCHAKAASLDKGEVSFTAPLQAMTPGLITFLALALGEFPGPEGATGVGLMMVGSYVLLWEKTPEHWLDYLGPLKRLRLLAHWRRLTPDERDKTLVVVLSLGSAALGTVGLLFDGLYTRRGVTMQGLLLGAMVITTLLTGIYSVGYRISGDRNNKSWSLRVWVAVLACSLMWVSHIVLIWPAYHNALVAYVGTLKRFSVLFSVLAGWLVFKESEFKRRLWAGGFIVMGAILISLDDIPARLTSKLEGLGF